MNGRDADKTLGEIVQEVSEKASLLVRQEIDLAKAEITEKVTSLGKGAGIAAAAGVFLFFARVRLPDLPGLLHQRRAGLGENIWLGFLIVFVLLVLLAAIAGLIAYRFFKKGAPPTPDMAIEEAKLTKAQFEHQGIERDQLGRSQDRPVLQEGTPDGLSAAHSRSAPRSRPPAASWGSRSTTCARRSPSSPTGAVSCRRTARRR